MIEFLTQARGWWSWRWFPCCVVAAPPVSVAVKPRAVTMPKTLRLPEQPPQDDFVMVEVPRGSEDRGVAL